jgi:hypothetical protein
VQDSRLSKLQNLHHHAMVRLKPWLFVSVIYARDCRKEAQKTPPIGYTARFVGKEELLDYCGNPELQLSKPAVARAFARGDVCTGMFHKGALVAYMWRSTSLAPHTDRVSVETRKPYRYGYKALTLPAYRGHHLPEYLAPVSGPYYIERGFPFSIGFVETHNFASRRSELRRGSCAVGLAGYLTLFNRIFTFRTRGVRGTGFRFVARQT